MQIQLREYQKNILSTCLNYNTLVILPTGTGKTIIAFFVIIERLNKYPNSKIIFLAPTRPLTNQHYQNFIKFFPEYKDISVVVTGDSPPERRESLYKIGKVIFVTPQTLQNDIISGRIFLGNISTLIFDEVHRAVKRYPYVFIAKKIYEASKDVRIIGLTASPGWNIERIKEVMQNLFIERIEIRTGREKDIEPYIPKIDIEKIDVELDENIKQIKDLLEKAIELRIEKLNEILPNVEIKKGKKDILEWIEEIRKQMEISPRDPKLRSGLMILSELLKISHALEVLETQTFYTFIEYFEEMRKDIKKTKSDYMVLDDIRIKKAIYLANEFIKKGYEHPKIKKLLEIVNQNKDKKIIIFAQIRKTLDRIKEYLDKEGLKSEKFVGKKEMSQSEQIKLLKRFSQGEFNILLATSVGEEGIDIPKVDLVIFYEPVPSEIRYIQRRGRTGRGEFGRVIILVTRDSIDERFYWVAVNKERKMLKLIKQIKKYIEGDKMEYKKENSEVENKQKDRVEDGIMKYISEKKETIEKKTVPVIIADYKEKESGVLQVLAERDLLVRLENLEYGDYIVGDLIIERKTIIDFINSIVDGRLHSQLEKLSDKNVILIIEGDEEEYTSVLNLPQNYIRSLILKILLEYKIPILRTKNFIETANYLYLLANESYKVSKIPERVKGYKNLDEVKVEVLKQIPGIGDTLARKLLERFKSLKNIFLAQKVELSNIVGEHRAERIKKIFEEEYKGEDRNKEKI